MKKQQGFTLIELLVSMAVSLLVITMIAGIFSTARINHDVQDDIAQLQENIRISSSLIRRVVFHAGHRARPYTGNSDLGLSGGIVAVTGIHGTATTANNQDAMILAFEGDGFPDVPSGSITDCLGNPVGVGTLADVALLQSGANLPQSLNRLQVRNFSGRPWLACSLDNGTNWVQLVPDVEAMELQYGEGSPEANAESFKNANAITIYDRVISVRINLLFRTNRPIATGNSSTTYTMGDQVYGPFNDMRVRRQVTITAGVRNAKI